MIPVKHPPFVDCLDALQVSKTLTALAAALTKLDVPYRDDWHEWIDQLVLKCAPPSTVAVAQAKRRRR